MRNIIFVTLLLINFTLLAQDKEKHAFKIFKDNKEVNWKTFVRESSEADIVFFGEFHNNPIHHWLQLELTKDLYEIKKNQLVLGAEMFESDVQLILNEYLHGNIRERNFTQEARVWTNYQTDYKPLVEFAKEKKLGFIATNIPRRYASVVNHGGFEALEKLSELAKSYIAPLPIEFPEDLPSYKSIASMNQMGGKSPAPLNLAKAQAIKDATMAWFILKNFEYGQLFVHYNGAFHSDNHEGIVWYLNKYNNKKSNNRKLNVLVISVEETDNMNEKPTSNKGDFVILTPSSMTKTH